MDKREINVLFLWQPPDRLKEYLTERLSRFSNLRLIIPESFDQNKLIGLAGEVDIIIGWRPTWDLLKASERLKLFINPGTGVEHLIEFFRNLNKIRSVTLVNGHGNSYFTAQHAVAMLLALTNQIIPHHNWMINGHWRKDDSEAVSIPLRDRRIGLLGYGHVNRKVHKFLSGFNVNFAVCRKQWNDSDGSFPTVVKKFDILDFSTFLEEIDTLIIAIPRTTQSDDLIGMNELKLLGSKGFLVNVSRGSVIDEESLYLALKNKIIAGAAIDVWYDYSPQANDKGQKFPCHYPFHKLDNVVLSPHRAASPFGDLRRWDEVIENISCFVNGRRDFVNTVNLEKEY